MRVVGVEAELVAMRVVGLCWAFGGCAHHLVPFDLLFPGFSCRQASVLVDFCVRLCVSGVVYCGASCASSTEAHLAWSARLSALNGRLLWLAGLLDLL